MWLSKEISSSKSEQQPEQGKITMSGSTIEAESSVRTRSINTYSPYGYSAAVPVGEEVMLIPSAGGQAIVGTRLKANKLDSGEVLISSKGGATILLKNDGSVIINSLKIDRNGVIEK